MESADPADEHDALADASTSAASQAQRRTILPNCRARSGSAYRLVRYSDGTCRYLLPTHDPSEWITSGPLPMCSDLSDELRCIWIG